MKVSIIIPTYNCAPLLRATLNSIRLCGWDDLEIIVRDGASSDGTMRQLEDFDDLPINALSEPDSGQYDAINKGFNVATGEILCWINAGDIFIPGAVGNVVDAFSSIPGMKWVTGRQCVAEDVKVRKVGEKILLVSDLEIRLGLCKGGNAGHLQQEGMFWTRELWEEAGPLDLSYKLAGDFELWTRFARVASLYRMRVPLAAFSYHETNRSITGGDEYRDEVNAAIDRLPPRIKALHRTLCFLPVFWRVCRRVPIIRVGFSVICHLFHVLPIRVVSFERKGSKFNVICESRPAWVS
jgi:hypothetical protein